MQPHSQTLIELETKFWQSMVDEDTDTALRLLDEPAVMVSPHGAMQFDHGQYRQMAEHGDKVLKDFELSDMTVVFPTEQTAVLTYRVKQALAERGDARLTRQEMADSSVWVCRDGRWLCVMHTETPLDGARH